MRIKSIVLAFLLIFLPAAAWASLAINGTPVSQLVSTQTNVISYTTSVANTEIIVLCRNTPVSQNASTISGITASGLTFTKRVAQTYINLTIGSFTGDVEEWAAPATSTFSGNITVTYNSASLYNQRCNVFAVSGQNISTPFDPNASLAASTSIALNNSTAALAMSTSNANDMLIGFYGAGSNNSSVTPPSGFSVILAPNANSNTSQDIVSSLQTAATKTWTVAGDGLAGMALILDALQQAAAPAAGQDIFFQGAP